MLTDGISRQEESSRCWASAAECGACADCSTYAVPSAQGDQEQPVTRSLGAEEKPTVYVARVRNAKGTMGRHEIGTKLISAQYQT